MCRRFIVGGRVQGVFFRKSAHKVALEFGLSGWVRNLSDGSVESLACGEQEQLDKYLTWLKSGPQLANVTNVEEFPASCSPTTGFEIR